MKTSMKYDGYVRASVAFVLSFTFAAHLGSAAAESAPKSFSVMEATIPQLQAALAPKGGSLHEI